MPSEASGQGEEAPAQGLGGRHRLAQPEVQYSLSHLVEIDLLRSGPPMPVVGDVPGGDYRILVSNARLAPDASLYVFSMRQPIPHFVMPLAEGSEGIAIDLKPILDEVYVLGSYDRDIDYQQDPQPVLCPTPTTSGSANCFGQRGCATAPIDGAIAPTHRADMTTRSAPTNPFPGMNPYLERNVIWPGVHLLAIAGLQGFLAPRLQPDYVVTVAERVHVVMEP